MTTRVIRSPFWDKIAIRKSDDEDLSKINILKSLPLFENLTKRELLRVAELVYDRTYDPGENMFEIYQPGAAMFIILSGEVRIVIPQKGGDTLTLATLTRGSSLGELALLDDSPRSASAVAVTRTQALAFFRTDLNKLLDTEPVIGSKLFKALAVLIGHRLKATNEQLEIARKEGVIEK